MSEDGAASVVDSAAIFCEGVDGWPCEMPHMGPGESASICAD